MKTIIQLVLIFFISTQYTYCQLEKFPFDSTTHKVTYQGVIDIANINKDQLYDRAMSWATKTFVSTKSVVDYSDKASGRIVLKPILPYKYSMLMRVFNIGHWEYTFTILVKDGKYKYIITDFIEKGDDDNNTLGPIETSRENLRALTSPTKKMYSEMLVQLSNSIERDIDNLKKSMQNKADTDF